MQSHSGPGSRRLSAALPSCTHTNGVYQRPVTRGNRIRARVPRWRLGRNTLLAETLFSLLLHVIYNFIKTEDLIAVAILLCACLLPILVPGNGGMQEGSSRARVWDGASWPGQGQRLSGLSCPPGLDTLRDPGLTQHLSC